MSRILKQLANQDYKGAVGFINHLIKENPDMYLPKTREVYNHWLKEINKPKVPSQLMMLQINALTMRLQIHGLCPIWEGAFHWIVIIMAGLPELMPKAMLSTRLDWLGGRDARTIGYDHYRYTPLCL